MFTAHLERPTSSGENASGVVTDKPRVSATRTRIFMQAHPQLWSNRWTQLCVQLRTREKSAVSMESKNKARWIVQSRPNTFRACQSMFFSPQRSGTLPRSRSCAAASLITSVVNGFFGGPTGSSRRLHGSPCCSSLGGVLPDSQQCPIGVARRCTRNWTAPQARGQLVVFAISVW